MTKPLEFAAVGLGSYVARKAVLPALRASSTTTLRGVSSSRHGEFTDSLQEGERRYGSLDEVLDDDTVEAVYIATPNHLHVDMIKRCVSRGRHVLCEKPMVLDAREVEQVAAAACDHGVVVAEAYMTYYHSRAKTLLRLVGGGELGKVVSIHSSFTGTLAPLSGYRLARDKGGGSLWDVGIYALAPIIAVLGSSPSDIAVTADWDSGSGVDLSLSAFLDYGKGVAADITTSFLAGETQSFEVVGSERCARITRSCTPGITDTAIELSDRDGLVEVIETAACDPYLAMVKEVGEAFSVGREPEWDLSRTKEVVELVSKIYGLARKGLANGSS